MKELTMSNQAQVYVEEERNMPNGIIQEQSTHKNLIHPLLIEMRSLVLITPNNLMLKNLREKKIFMIIQHVWIIFYYQYWILTHLNYLLNIDNLRWLII